MAGWLASFTYSEWKVAFKERPLGLLLPGNGENTFLLPGNCAKTTFLKTRSEPILCVKTTLLKKLEDDLVEKLDCLYLGRGRVGGLKSDCWCAVKRRSLTIGAGVGTGEVGDGENKRAKTELNLCSGRTGVEGVGKGGAVVKVVVV